MQAQTQAQTTTATAQKYPQTPQELLTLARVISRKTLLNRYQNSGTRLFLSLANGVYLDTITEKTRTTYTEKADELKAEREATNGSIRATRKKLEKEQQTIAYYEQYAGESQDLKAYKEAIAAELKDIASNFAEATYTDSMDIVDTVYIALHKAVYLYGPPVPFDILYHKGCKAVQDALEAMTHPDSNSQQCTSYSVATKAQALEHITTYGINGRSPAKVTKSGKYGYTTYEYRREGHQLTQAEKLTECTQDENGIWTLPDEYYTTRTAKDGKQYTVRSGWLKCYHYYTTPLYASLDDMLEAGKDTTTISAEDSEKRILDMVSRTKLSESERNIYNLLVSPPAEESAHKAKRAYLKERESVAREYERNGQKQRASATRYRAYKALPTIGKNARRDYAIFALYGDTPTKEQKATFNTSFSRLYKKLSTARPNIDIIDYVAMMESNRGIPPMSTEYSTPQCTVIPTLAEHRKREQYAGESGIRWIPAPQIPADRWQTQAEQEQEQKEQWSARQPARIKSVIIQALQKHSPDPVTVHQYGTPQWADRPALNALDSAKVFFPDLYTSDCLLYAMASTCNIYAKRHNSAIRQARVIKQYLDQIDPTPTGRVKKGDTLPKATHPRKVVKYVSNKHDFYSAKATGFFKRYTAIKVFLEAENPDPARSIGTVNSVFFPMCPQKRRKPEAKQFMTAFTK